MTEQRLEREKTWHDKRFSNPHIRDEETSKFYSICNSIDIEYQNFIFTHSSGRNILEYGCGTGSQAFDIVESGASSVTGIDISDTAINKANLIIQEKGLQHRPIVFKVMNAEELEFPNNSIDIICGSGILHHLDLNKSMKSITRTLKPSGSAVFVEPLGHNMLINIYRKLTPHIRTEDEHPLLRSDIKLIEQYFNKVEIRFFYLFSLIAVPFFSTPIFYPLLKFLESLDNLVFKIPFFKWQAWQVLIELSDPIQN
jgi:ubiquinone/menaquinone biosynthesis C-methylase UbiE